MSGTELTREIVESMIAQAVCLTAPFHISTVHGIRMRDGKVEETVSAGLMFIYDTETCSAMHILSIEGVDAIIAHLTAIRNEITYSNPIEKQEMDATTILAKDKDKMN